MRLRRRLKQLPKLSKIDFSRGFYLVLNASALLRDPIEPPKAVQTGRKAVKNKRIHKHFRKTALINKEKQSNRIHKV